MDKTIQKPSRIPRLHPLKNTLFSNHQQQNGNFPVEKGSSPQNTKPSPTCCLKTPAITSGRASKTSQTSARVIKSPLHSGRGSSSSSSRRTSLINPPAASDQISCAKNRSVSNLTGGNLQTARQISQASNGECDPDNLSPVQRSVASEKVLTDDEFKNLEATTDAILESALNEMKALGVSNVFDMECFQPPSNLASLSSSCCSEANDVASDDKTFSLSNLIKQMDLDFMKIPSPSPLEEAAEDQPSSENLGNSASELHWQPSCVWEDSSKPKHVNAAGSIQRLVGSEPINPHCDVTSGIVEPPSEKSLNNLDMKLVNLETRQNVSVIPLEIRASNAGSDEIERTDRKQNKRSLTGSKAPENETCCGKICASFSQNRVKLSSRKRKPCGGGITEALQGRVSQDLERTSVLRSTHNDINDVKKSLTIRTPKTKSTISPAREVQSTTLSQLPESSPDIKTCSGGDKPCFSECSTIVPNPKRKIDGVIPVSKLEKSVKNSSCVIVKARNENGEKSIYLQLEKFEKFQEW